MFDYNHRVEAVLAFTSNGVVGQADMIPWHHSGDLKHFKKLTQGHALLMGAKTYLGIARHYVKPGKTVLPGRKIFIYGEDRNGVTLLDSIKLELERMNKLVDIEHGISTVTSTMFERRVMLDKILSKLDPSEKLFIAGGATVYDKFIQYAAKVHATMISGYDEVLDANTVRLTPWVMSYLCLMQNSTVDWLADASLFFTASDCESEIEAGLTANYVTLAPLQKNL